MTKVLDILNEAVSAAFAQEGVQVTNPVSLSDRADFQSNSAFGAARTLGMKPIELAERITKRLMENKNVQAEVTGNGFISLTVAKSLVEKLINENIAASPASGRKIIIDYGGPNVAKPLHVGHLRSLIIGDAIKRIMQECGDVVIGDAHLGDWGLQIGLLLATISERDIAACGLTAEDLEVMYPEASTRAKTDPEFKKAAQAATANLQNGDPVLWAMWSDIIRTSRVHLEHDIAALGVKFDLWLGESDTRDVVPAMVADLTERGIAQKSDGATIIPLSGPPLILENSEGGALYATTDLATILMRAKEDPTAILYVVDQRQALHFQQVFAAAQQIGCDGIAFEHLGFGTVNGPDGKPLKTRDGGVPKLRDLIEAATAKAYERLGDDKKDPVLAGKIAIAALKFADLQNARTTSYVFDLDQFVQFEGKTGPYLIYQAVRIKSIFEKATASPGPITIDHPHERAVALALLDYPRIIALAYEKRSPDVIANYAYTLAQTFSRFYAELTVGGNPSRVALSGKVLERLNRCLFILGIEAPDRM